MADPQEYSGNSGDNIDNMSTTSSSSSELNNAGAVGGIVKDIRDNVTEMAPEPGTLDGVEKLLQRHRSEIMFELRRLRHGDRPVTGQDNRSAVENFFLRNFDPEAAAAQGVQPVPPEEHRPEEVVVEVQGLVQTRPVSSILQSAVFRRRLENVIRGGLQSALQRPLPVNRASNPRPSTPQPSAPPAPPPLPNNGSVNQNIPQTLPANEGPVAPLPSHPSPIRIQSWVQEQQVGQNAEEQRQMFVWDSIGQAHREGIIMDISDLVHRELVTGTLEGNFRNTLEHLLSRRVQDIGLDGQRTAQFIQNISQSHPHRRNDFSELGIGHQAAAAAGSDNLDEISVISATAAVRVNNSQQNAYFNHEIRSLKSQMDELKQMMRMSFDIQLDIQRSIRQEVAAALSQALGTATEAPIPHSSPVQDTHCIICLDGHADSVLYQCGHMCLCFTCGKTLQQRGSHCPICRAPIKDVIRAYKSSGNTSDD